MTVSDLLDQIAGQASDDSSAFRIDARRWLNLVRSQIATEALWRWAMRASATITTSAATTTGLYTLVDGGTAYEFIAGDWLFDETNKQTIQHESYGPLRAVDQAKNTTGPPAWWGDAGQNGNGQRQIYLWPIPNGTYTVTFPGYLLLTDLDETHDNYSEDPFYGPISPWGSTFAQGLRYYYDQDNNESTDAALSLRYFERAIAKRKVLNRTSLVAPIAGRIVRTQTISSAMGRFDPAHFQNR